MSTEGSPLVDASGAKLASEPEKKLSPLFFLGKDAREYLRNHGAATTNGQVQESFKAWQGLTQNAKNELTFMLLVMPR